MTFAFKTAKKLLELTFELDYFQPGASKETPIPYHWTPARKSNFVVVVGENASGKSFLRRVLSAVAHKTKVEPMTVSMEGRQTGGFERAFIYGDEGRSATGNLSCNSVLTGISTCKSRDKPHIIVWDEPDLGLSDSWAKSMGITFQEFANDLPEKTLAVVVITHNSNLLRELISVDHHFVCLGDEGYENLTSWVNRPLSKVKPLKELAEEEHKRFKKILTVLRKAGIS